MRDYYYLWEVLLSLRVEYLNNRKELDELKPYIICDDKRVDDFYFWLFRNYKNELSIWINTKEKKEWLNYIRKLLGTYVIGFDENLLERKNNNLRLVSNKFDINLNLNYIEELNDKIDKIIETDFVQKMCLSVNDTTKKIFLNLTRINLRSHRFDFNYYCLDKESILIGNHCKNEKITDEFIWNILNTKIPKSYLNEYHHTIIEKNLNQKEISLLDKYYGKSFANIELKDEKSLVLCKKKRSILSK